MKIQINTDKNISGNERLVAYINSTIEDDLARFSDNITRIEVHLSDENGSKGGQNDKRCMLEARLEKKNPIAVTSQADTIEKSVSDALDKMKSALETTFGQLKNR
ncbi:MAG: ribosome-associated translation inhibitor RaiA [Flavobacteriales bacterium]|jgi:ribosome-associated translation inhibitor RaiA